jgi:hypothetical protein
VKCGARIEAPTPLPPSPPRALASSCIYCGKQLDPATKFCGQCGREVIHPQTQIANTASKLANQNFEKYAERYRQMSDAEIIRLSDQLEELTDVAQKALSMEISKRGLKGSSQTVETVRPASTVVDLPQSDKFADWDYEKMSDDELQQLAAAYQKVRQPINESLRIELEARSARRAQNTPTVLSKQIETVQASLPIATTAESVRAIPIKETSAPYGKFVAQFLVFCLCASVGVYSVFDASARNTTAFAIEIVSLVLCLVMGWIIRKTWKSVLDNESRNDSKSKHRIRSVVVTSLIFFVLYIGLAVLLGSVIGQNRAEAAQLDLDMDNQKKLAHRIGEARNSVSDSMSSYLAMYTEIGSDVDNYSATLLRLRNEIPVYISKFPKQTETMKAYANTVEREIRRSELLKKQIATAKKIAQLNEYQQAAAWRGDMLPILEEEAALDKSK